VLSGKLWCRGGTCMGKFFLTSLLQLGARTISIFFRTADLLFIYAVRDDYRHHMFLSRAISSYHALLLRLARATLPSASPGNAAYTSITLHAPSAQIRPVPALHGAVTQQRASPLLVPVSAPQHGTRPRRCSR